MLTIVGPGITGRSIARYCQKRGIDFQLVGRTTPIKYPGLFYVHEEIPEITRNPITVSSQIYGPNDREDYLLKSRSEVVEESSFDKLPNEITGYMIDPDIWKVPCHECWITGISEDHMTTTEGIIEYEGLIMTISLPSVLKLLVHKDQETSKDWFKFIPIYLEYERADDLDMSRIIVIYNSDLSDYWYRKTIYPTGLVIKEISAHWWKAPVDDSWKILVPGKIIPDERINGLVSKMEMLYQNMLLVGRFAKWDYRMMVHDCIREFQEWYGS